MIRLVGNEFNAMNGRIEQILLDNVHETHFADASNVFNLSRELDLSYKVGVWWSHTRSRLNHNRTQEYK